METPIQRVARAMVEATDGPFDLLSPEGKQAALEQTEAGIRALANVTDEEWGVVRRYLQTSESKTNFWAAIDGLADFNIH